MEFLINIALKSTLILLFSGLILLSLKKNSATLRHWIISLTMIGLLLLPILAALIPDIEVTIPYLPPNEMIAEVQMPVAVPMAVPPSITNVETIAPVIEADIKIAPIISEKIIDSQTNIFVEKEPSRFDNEPISFSQILPLIWLFGCGFFLLKLCLGLLSIRKITINSSPFALPKDLQKNVTSFTKKKVRFLVNSTIKTPMTWGGFRPVILLPETASAWSTTELETVLIHELNHIKRNDYWVHTLGLLAVCFYWCNPLIWIMKRQQLLEREKACDEAVLRAGIRQQNYAEQLVNIARQLSTHQSIISEHALPMAKVSQTKARVLAILSFDDERFQFSAWKQRNWGLLYVLLFPILAAFSPVGENLIPTSFDLPQLEKIGQFLETEGLRNETINSIFSTNSTISDLEDSVSPLTMGDFSNGQEGFSSITPELAPLTNLRKVDFSLPIDGLDEVIKMPNRTMKTGLYGQWTESKSEFKIWTYGDFKLIPTAPYIEVISDNGIVFIEEYIPGLFRDKINQLTITKAPYDCRERADYNKSMDMRPEALIKKGTPIKIWSQNSNYEKWITTKGPKIASILNEKVSTYVEAVDESNKSWFDRMERMPNWIEMNFIEEQEVKANLLRQERGKAIKLNKIPYRSLKIAKENLESQMIGRTTLSGSTIGNMSTSPVGNKYVTVLKGKDSAASIKDFNFHLANNDFKNLSFELSIYNIENGEVMYAITKNPIPIQLKEGSGWISKDLRPFNIVSKGDVLIVLENKGFTGRKNRKKLYFSLSETHQQYQPIIEDTNRPKSKIWEEEYVMYLTVDTPVDSNSDTNGKSGYLINFQKNKNKYKVWTYGAFKTHQKAPFIEILSPDGMVVIEITENKAIGNKTCLFTLTKAPQDGIFVQHFKNDQINNFVGDIKKNDLLWLLPENKKNWVFVSTQDDKWTEENLSMVFEELGRLKTGSSDYQPATEKDVAWWSVIQKQQALVNKRFKTITSDFNNKEELEANGMRPYKESNLKTRKIIFEAIDNLKNNYIQKPHSANLFYRFSSFNKMDSLGYQSESVLKYYDSKGYKKGGWRNVSASRHAQLEQSRITKGNKENIKRLDELGRIFVFWAHEPIITNDKPLSDKSFNAYDYKLIGMTKFMEQDVFEIAFTCTKLKNRFAGLPSLKSMKGRIYVNKEDYAILKYEHEYLMDYAFTGKHPKKRGHLKERNIIHGSRVEIFAKSKDGYYLDFAKKTEKVKNEHTLLDGTMDEKEGTYVEEYQYSGISTESIKSLPENLLKINNEAKFNPEYWSKFDK